MQENKCPCSIGVLNWSFEFFQLYFIWIPILLYKYIPLSGFPSQNGCIIVHSCSLYHMEPCPITLALYIYILYLLYSVWFYLQKYSENLFFLPILPGIPIWQYVLFGLIHFFILGIDILEWSSWTIYLITCWV